MLVNVYTDTNTQESEARLRKDLTRLVRNTGMVIYWPKKGNKMKQGDVVYLNSGSPELTIENITGEFVKCIWFDGNVAESATFHSACLTLKK